jgi:oxalate decarboxylase/phosphoglucose isomerase-like protein (cupin superfamily)
MKNLFKFMSSEPQKYPGGKLWRASLKNFGALKGLAIQALELKSGAFREPHVHPNANQLDYCLSGSATVGIVGPEGHRQNLELKEGDISFVPQGYLHWIENTSDKTLDFLVILSHEEPETIELSEMMSGVTPHNIKKLFGVEAKDFGEIPTGGHRIKGGF